MTPEDRLARVERQLRWHRRVGALCLAAIAVLVLAGQGTNAKAIVEAQRFLVRDSEGQVRAELGWRKDYPDSVMLLLHDGSGTARVGLGHGRGGSSLLFYAKDGSRKRVTMAADERGSAWLYLNENDHTVPGASLCADKERGAELALGATQSRQGITATVSEAGESRIVFEDKDGKVIWKAPGE